VKGLSRIPQGVQGFSTKGRGIVPRPEGHGHLRERGHSLTAGKGGKKAFSVPMISLTRKLVTLSGGRDSR